jgi:hypothetical protein
MFNWQKLHKTQVRNLMRDAYNEDFLKELGWSDALLRV